MQHSLMPSHEDLKRSLRFNLMRRKFPFDWKTQKLPATLYQGEPYVARPQKIDISEDLVSSSKEAVLKVANKNSEVSKKTRGESEDFWDAVAKQLKEDHEDDNMISFHIFEFDDDDFFIRYHVIY